MFAQRLKELRLGKGITQAQFANIFNISAGTIAMWETEKRTPDLETVRRIAKFFDVTVDYLVGDENESVKADKNVSPRLSKEDAMFSTKLKELREKNKLNQSELASIFNVTQGTVGNWETERRTPDLETIKKIANYFNVSVDYLAGNEYAPPTLSNVYLSFAKNAQDNGILPEDIETAIDMIKKLRGQDGGKK